MLIQIICIYIVYIGMNISQSLIKLCGPQKQFVKVLLILETVNFIIGMFTIVTV